MLIVELFNECEKVYVMLDELVDWVKFVLLKKFFLEIFICLGVCDLLLEIDILKKCGLMVFFIRFWIELGNLLNLVNVVFFWLFLNSNWKWFVILE